MVKAYQILMVLLPSSDYHQNRRLIVPVSRALIGNRSAVVIRTPKGDVQEKRIPAGKIHRRIKA